MTQGLYLKFHTQPILSLFPANHAKSTEHPNCSPIYPRLVTKGCSKKKFLSSSSLFLKSVYSSKKCGKRRPIIDLSILNRLICIPKFRMDIPHKIVKCLIPGFWGISVDLQNVYFHLPLAWEYQKYFAFKLGNRVFIFQMLPFGFSPAPCAFTYVMTPIIKQLQIQNIRCSFFVDD